MDNKNKETLQNYNNILGENNTVLDTILETINSLPEAGSGEPNLQDKSIEITENGTINIVADEGYDGLNNVEIITGVEGSVGKYTPKYITFKGYTGTDLIEETANLDTSKLTSMVDIFNQCTNLVNVDLSGWDTSNVTTMGNPYGSMFNSCKSLTSLDLSHFNTSNVDSMYNLFKECNSLESLNISNFNTNNVTTMEHMFSACKSLLTLHVNHFNTSNVTNMRYMFYGCEKLTELDLSNFDTSKVTTMEYMFANCPSLKYLDIRNFTFNKVTAYTYMFGTSVMPFSTDCLIIVKDDTAKSWILARRSDFTNVKTVAEL